MSGGDEQLGLTEAISFALGGVIGGGIFAVLGVVALVAGPAAWLAYGIAGVVALCTGYSYVKLNEHSARKGGSVTFVEEYLGSPTLAGVVGWTLLVGYIGTMAMYGYAFGAYFGALFGVERLPILGLPARPVLSALVVVGFVGLNAVGVRESGLVEDVLVAVKLGVVALFGLVGVWASASRGLLTFGAERILAHPAGPVVAAGLSFVSFEGWQLLMYDQGSIERPVETVKKAVYVSIPVATVAYVLVALVTLSLVSREQVVAHPDLALALAAEQFLGEAGYLLVGLAAVASTASAINATVFSTAQFSKHMVADGLLPDQFGDPDSPGPSVRSLLIIGALTVGATVLGSLEAVTEFASLAFVVVFGAVSYLALRESRGTDIRAPVPAVGLAGTLAFLPLFAWHLYTEQFGTFALVVAIAAAVLAAEVLYFEREALAEGVREVEKRV